MEARNTYEWAQDKIDTVIGPEHREQRARERRLRQMQEKREKDAKRAAPPNAQHTNVQPHSSSNCARGSDSADAIRALGRQHE